MNLQVWVKTIYDNPPFKVRKYLDLETGIVYRDANGWEDFPFYKPSSAVPSLHALLKKQYYPQALEYPEGV